MVKNSFTLFETILSITILIFIISGFLNSTYYEQNPIKNYMLLNNLENKFNTNDYKDLVNSQTTLKLTINKSEKKDIKISVYTYEDENIKVFKYEK